MGKTIIGAVMGLLVSFAAFAAENSYRLNPGDVIEISIWKEDNLKRRVVVLPDGMISYPLAGHLLAAGKTPQEVEDELTRKLKDGKFFTSPTLNVSVVETSGNQIFVIGEVKNAGAFVLRQQLDVMQALSLAGGLTKFADRREIIVLRRIGGKQQVYSFNYDGIAAGKNANRNIVLRKGDTVVVPSRGLF
jgi:polysaccharide export outer membrane protein